MPKDNVSMRGNGSFSLGAEHSEATGAPTPAPTVAAGKADPGQASLAFAVSHRELDASRSEEHTSELQSRQYLVCRLLLEKKTQYTLVSQEFSRDTRAATVQWMTSTH